MRLIPHSSHAHFVKHRLQWKVLLPVWIRNFLRFLLILMILMISTLLGVDALIQKERAEQLARDKEYQRSLLGQKDQDTSNLTILIPKPFPFPSYSRFTEEREETFKIPDAEFTLRISKPILWSKTNLNGETVQFRGIDRFEGEIIFKTGCFGSCDTLDKNIANSLESKIKRYSHQGKNPRVVHWHVHHKTWVEYSILYYDSEGHPWLHGSSLRWDSSWLNALQCDYRASIDFHSENEDVLHFAWDGWAPFFVHYCRDYKVVSWE